jgi:hypothetical protein
MAPLKVTAPYKFTQDDIVKGNHLILHYVFHLEKLRAKETKWMVSYLDNIKENPLLHPFLKYKHLATESDEDGNKKAVKRTFVRECYYLNDQKRARTESAHDEGQFAPANWACMITNDDDREWFCPGFPKWWYEPIGPDAGYMHPAEKFEP